MARERRGAAEAAGRGPTRAQRGGPARRADHAPAPGRRWRVAGLQGLGLAILVVLAVLLLPGCAADGSCTVRQGPDGAAVISCPDGTRATVRGGADGASCTVADHGDGTKTVSCDDGTHAVLSDGASCTVVDGGDGTKTFTCDDGTRFVVADGDAHSTCTVTSNPDGSATISCTDGTAATLEGRPGGAFEGDFRVERAADALVLSGFTEVTGALTVRAPTLTTLGPLMLARVGGDVIVEESPALKTLAGLELLSEVGGDVRVDGNDVLMDLAGLDGLETLGGALTVTDDPALPQCEAEALRDRLAAAGWIGQATLAGNDDGARCP